MPTYEEKRQALQQKYSGGTATSAPATTTAPQYESKRAALYTKYGAAPVSAPVKEEAFSAPNLDETRAGSLRAEEVKADEQAKFYANLPSSETRTQADPNLEGYDPKQKSLKRAEAEAALKFNPDAPTEVKPIIEQVPEAVKVDLARGEQKKADAQLKAGVERAKELQRFAKEPLLFGQAIMQGRVLPDEMGSIYLRDKDLPWAQLLELSLQDASQHDDIKAIANLGLRNEKAGRAALQNYMAKRETTGFDVRRGIDTAFEDTLSLGTSPLQVTPQTTAGKAANFATSVVSQIPLTAGIGSAAGRVTTNPILRGALTGAGLETARQTAQGIANPEEFNLADSLKSIATNAAEYAAYTGVYNKLEPRIDSLIARSPRLEKVMDNLAGDVAKGVVGGAGAGLTVGTGKAVLDSLSENGFDVREMARQAIEETGQEAKEELVEAIALGIVQRLTGSKVSLDSTTSRANGKVDVAEEGPQEREAPPVREEVAPATQTPPQVEQPQAQTPPVEEKRSRSDIVREANPGMDEKAILDIVNTTRGLSDSEFSSFVERMGKSQESTPPVASQATQPETTTDEETFTKGDNVFWNVNGERRTGTIAAVNAKTGFAFVQPEGTTDPASRAQVGVGDLGRAQSEETQKPTPVEEKPSVQESLRQKVEARTGVTGETGAVALRGPLQVNPKQPQQTQQFTFEDEETEARYRGAKGLGKEPLLAKVQGWLRTIKNQMTREFEALPKTANFEQLRFRLNRMRTSAKGVASDKSVELLRGITLDLTPQQYDLFTRKLILDDLTEDVKRKREEKVPDEDIALPFNLTPQSLAREHQRVDSAVANDETVNNAVNERNALIKEVTEEYVKAAQDSTGFTPPVNRENYFRHQVLAYMTVEDASVRGTGKRLKAPTGRSFLKGRKGTSEDFNTEYLQAEHEVLTQMLYDTQVFKLLEFIRGKYDKTAELKEKYGKDWRKELGKEGLVLWQPREGNHMFKAWTLPERLVQEAMRQELESIEVPMDKVREQLIIGGRRLELAIPHEIASTLNNLSRERKEGVIEDGIKAAVRRWKAWQILGFRRWFKYNARNFSGDLDSIIQAQPAALKQVPSAFEDLYKHLINKGSASAELQGWLNNGGLYDIMQVAENVGDIQGLDVFWNVMEGQRKKLGLKTVAELPVDVLRKVWKVFRGSTDFREALLRYSMYKHYLQQMKSNDGKPKDFGASDPELVMALSSVEDRAFKLANEALGAYDQVSVFGQWLRDRIAPFWSFQEVNMRRQMGLLKNAFRDGEMTTLVGRKAAGIAIRSPLIAYRLGKFTLKATAFTAALSLYNHLLFADEEEELPENVKAKPHIVFGRDKDGKVIYFDRLGVLGDVLEWFGADESPRYVQEYLNGRMSLGEIAKEMAKSPVNKVAQVAGGPVKSIVESAFRKTIFPDVFNPRSIRDPWEHIAGSFGLRDEFIAVAGKPSRGYTKSLTNLFVYRIDPEETAYNEMTSKKYEWLKKEKGQGDFSSFSAKSNALYYLKQAIRFGDEEAMKKYLLEYASLGGTKDGMTQSLENMAPLAGLSKAEQKEFLAQLTESEKENLKRAEVFYKTVLVGGDVESLPEYKAMKRK